MKHFYRYVFLIGVCVALSSCDALDEPEPIPAFIKIDSISLSTDYNTEGSASNNIVDAWVYVENSLLGIFELPALVPYLGEGPSRVNVFAGIMNNGMVENRSEYSFYERSSEILTLTSGQTTTYNPTVVYKDADFVLNDNFDFFTLFDITPGTVNWNTTTVASEVFEGSRSMRIDLNETNPTFKMQSTNFYTLAPSGTEVYIELDFKTSHDITIGILPIVTGQNTVDEPVINFKASEDWSKEYIPLGAIINSLNADTYAIYITASLLSGEETGTFFFDNVKLIQF